MPRNLYELRRDAADVFDQHIRPALARVLRAVLDTLERTVIAELRVLLLAMQAALPGVGTVLA